jgi:hypothetical protein
LAAALSVFHLFVESLTAALEVRSMCGAWVSRTNFPHIDAAFDLLQRSHKS